MGHNYATIPSPESEYSVGWARRLVASLREIFAQPTHLESVTVAGLPPANSVDPGTMYYVSNESGGNGTANKRPAFSDGTNWRRVTDRAVVS